VIGSPGNTTAEVLDGATGALGVEGVEGATDVAGGTLPHPVTMIVTTRVTIKRFIVASLL
jgi:hypothetical protein